MKAATQMVFIIEEKQFVGSLEGAVPVLIQQVSFSRSGMLRDVGTVLQLLFIQLIDVKIYTQCYTMLNKSQLLSINKSISFYCSCGLACLHTSIFCNVTVCFFMYFDIILDATFPGSRSSLLFTGRLD